MKREEVDQRMVRALHDMPERLAEEAVLRYGRSADDNVRNRQGFMVRGRAVVAVVAVVAELAAALSAVPLGAGQMVELVDAFMYY